MATDGRPNADDDGQPSSSEVLTRRGSILKAAQSSGLLGEKDGRIAGRVPQALLMAAKKRSGIQSDSDLIEYALATVALEDDFGERLLAREGTISPDLDLEF